jgi:serine/threonine protein kinase
MPLGNIHLCTLTPSIDNLTLGSTQSVEQAHELLSFLEISQWFNIDLLSVSWQPKLGKVGVGGTSDIFQSLVNASTAFTFKCCSTNPEETNTEQLYRNLKAEVMSLSHLAIQRHPNIVNLVGICWDVKQDETVYPVLVTEKSQRGDMRMFLHTREGTEMSIQDRLHLCCEVACALDALHAAGTLKRKWQFQEGLGGF